MNAMGSCSLHARFDRRGTRGDASISLRRIIGLGREFPLYPSPGEQEITARLEFALLGCSLPSVSFSRKYFEKPIAIALELRGTHTRNAQELIAAPRVHHRHLQERRIAEDDVGGNAA